MALSVQEKLHSLIQFRAYSLLFKKSLDSTCLSCLNTVLLIWMKLLYLALSLLIVSDCFSQVTVNDLGKKTYGQVRAVESLIPCEVTDNLIVTYCVEEGSRLSYLFKNQVLDKIMTMTAFPTLSLAERQLEREISKAKSSLGVEPFLVGGQTLFNTLESPIFVSYGIKVINQTYFMIHLIGKK